MFNSKLNRQFQAFPKHAFAILKMSLFGLGWNLIFHSLILCLLVYWSFTSRNGNFNQFWTENQLLLATLCQGAMVLFFRDQLKGRLRFLPQNRALFFSYLARGTAFSVLIAIGLTLSKKYDFLGFTSQAHLNFFSSYAWILRAAILAVFVFCTELFLHGIVIARLPSTLSPRFKTAIASLTLLAIYVIWFDVSVGEALTLIFLCVLFDQFWTACGFLISFFVLTHAVLSLPWMGNDFSGLAQLKSTPYEARFLETPVLQATLLVLIIAFKVIPFYYSKRKRGNLPETTS